MLPFNGFENSMISGRPDPVKFQSVPNDDESVRQLLQVTTEEAERISNLPQDLPNGSKNPEWLASRRPFGISRITGSVIGGISGHNKYCTPKESLAQFLSETPFAGNDATRYGQLHENDAEQSFRQLVVQNFHSWFPGAVKWELNHYGLIIDPWQPEFAYSPDGELQIFYEDRIERILLEIKCPFSKQFKPFQNEPLYPMTAVKLDNKKRLEVPIPWYYYDQITLGMKIMQAKESLFIVWTPQQTQVFKFNYDQIYAQSLMAKSRYWFWNTYLPALREKTSQNS